MREMLKIELKKFNLKEHIKGVIIANIAIFILVIASCFMTNSAALSSASAAALPSISTISIMDTFVKATFLVWQSVLIANLIIEEFRSKTIMLLFTYPLERKAIIISKLVIICVVSFLSILVTQVVQNVLLFVVNEFLPFIQYSITAKDVAVIALTTMTSMMTGMFPLYVGMMKKSTVATVVSSIIIVSLTVTSQGEAGGLITMIPVSITLGLIGIIFSAIAIKDITKNDLII